jgi:hypothetical protein
MNYLKLKFIFKNSSERRNVVTIWDRASKLGLKLSFQYERELHFEARSSIATTFPFHGNLNYKIKKKGNFRHNHLNKRCDKFNL